MDGLAEFEKDLARERVQREQEELQRKEKRPRQHHHRREHRHRRDTSRERHNKDRKNTDRGGDGHTHGEKRTHRDRTPDDAGSGSRQKHSRDRPQDEGSDDNGNRRHKRSRPSKKEPDSRDSAAQHPRRDGGEDGADDNAGGTDSEPEYLHTHDPKEDLPLPDGEKPLSEQPLARDSWMTAPSGVNIDYIHRQKKEKTPPPKNARRHEISQRELNSDALQRLNRGEEFDELGLSAQSAASYTFGDEGSQWRMTKLNGVYTVAERTGRPLDEVAVERFGNLKEFDEAREEKAEMERRRLYGKGYAIKQKPTGELHRERLEHTKKVPHRREPARGNDEAASRSSSEQPRQTAAPVDQTTLNRLRAQLMKAKLRDSPDVAKLELEYEQAMAAFSSGSDQNAAERAVVLDAIHSRMLAGTRGEVKAIETRRGKERGLVEANEGMSIEDMIREERRTRGAAGGEGLRLAERIAKDAKFDDDLEYLDENAEKLSKRVHQSEANLKNAAVHEYTKMNKILESCPLCHHEDRKPPKDLPLAPIISLATRVFLTLPTEPELTGAEGGAVIVPIDHHTNLLECNDDEWEEIRNFMKSLTRLYHDQGREVIFYENAAAPNRRMHAALAAVPIPYELGDTAPAFFREAMLAADEEWSQHKKIIDTGKRARDGLGKSAFRKSIAKEMPYFHAWFTLDGGLGHVVEDASRWPKGDLFAREIVGGMLDVDASVVKRQGRWQRNDPRLDDFKKRWRKFDWTRILTEAQ